MLNLRPNHISENGVIKIKGLKGSDDRFAEPVYFKEFWIKQKARYCRDLKLVNRFSYYRFVKRQGWHFKVKGNKNQSVTHLFRHLYAYRRQQLGFENVNKTSVLGHKSVKNLNYYVKG